MSRKSQRDESLEHLLRESLGTSSRTPAPGLCLDAETLAAWADGALAGGQLAMAQEHVADCSACQATLAALARTTPPVVSPEPWWRRGLSARWLVPVAATATAIAIWVAVPREEFTRPPEQARTAAGEVAVPQTEAAAEPPAAAVDSAAADTRSAQSRPIEQLAAEPRLEAAQKAASADAIEERRDAEPPALQQPAAEPRPEAPVDPALAGARARQGAAPAPPGRAATAAPEPAAPAPAQPRALGTLQERVTTLQESVAVVSQPIEIVSPGGQFRWRIGAAGAVDYSADKGGTWQEAASGVTTDLTAGASPFGTVCWIVGRAGTVLLTSDGRQWRRLMLPVTVDLTAVQATDARTATVTAIDGRRFRTADGGATWERI